MAGNPSSEIFRWSTEDVPRNQRLDCYVGTVCENLIHVTTSSPERKDFRAEVVVAPLGALRIAALGGSIHDAYRTRKDIARSREQLYHLVVGIKTQWKLSINDSLVHLRPGDVVLSDSRMRQSIHWPADCNALNVSLPIEWLHTWIPEPGRLVGQRISRESPWGSILSSVLAKLTPERAVRAPLPASVMTDQLGALLALAATEIPGCFPRPFPTYREQRDKIHSTMRERCCELQLTAADVAACVKLSPRTLHRILASFGETFGKKLMDMRLEVAARMLQSTLFDQVTTAEIGRRTGFVDPSHFIRVCRKALGRTPNQLRRARIQ